MNSERFQAGKGIFKLQLQLVLVANMLLQGIELLLVFLKLLFEGSFQQLKGGLQGAVLVILFLGVAAKEEEGYKEKDDGAELKLGWDHEVFEIWNLIFLGFNPLEFVFFGL